MNEQPVTCPICRTEFLLSQHPGCMKCPLHRKCVMICCPSCGYSIVLPEQSTIIKLTSKLVSSKRSKEKRE